MKVFIDFTRVDSNPVVYEGVLGSVVEVERHFDGVPTRVGSFIHFNAWSDSW